MFLPSPPLPPFCNLSLVSSPLPPSFPLLSVHLLLSLPAELETGWGQAICCVASEGAPPKKRCCLSSPRSTMPCSCSTRPPTDTEVRRTDPFPRPFNPYTFPRLRWFTTLPPVLPGYLLITLHPPRASFLWAELEETNRASLISQSVNLDQDKASLSTSSPPWDWSIMTAYRFCSGLLARKGGKKGWVLSRSIGRGGGGGGMC